MAIKLADTARPNNYVDAEHLGTFPVAYAEDVWFADGTRLSEKTLDGQSIQKEELPLASEDELENIYQYIGADGTYKHGCFYECVENGGEYSWRFLEVAGKIVYNAETPPKLTGDEISYNDGDVFVYSGDDAHGFLKGHHYKYMENFTIDNINRVIFNLNSEHTTRRITYMAESNIKVGTMLYVHYNNEEKYKSGLSVVAIEGDIVTLWDERENSEITIEYGYSIEPTTDTAIVAFGYIDIGGGGSGNDYEEFIGTQEEWNTLSQYEKAKYDGKVVNIIESDETSTKIVEELTNYVITEAALTAFSDITQRMHVYKYGKIIQVCCDNIAIKDKSVLGDYFHILDGLPAPVYTVNFAYPTYPDDSVGYNSLAAGYVGTGGNLTLRHVGMISPNATYLQGFSVMYITKEV